MSHAKRINAIRQRAFHRPDTLSAQDLCDLANEIYRLRRCALRVINSYGLPEQLFDDIVEGHFDFEHHLGFGIRRK